MKTAPTPVAPIEMPSLSFPKDRAVLYVHEVAERWRVTDQHVINLLEEGKLNGFDISGRNVYVRVPMNAVQSLAQMFRVDQEIILKVIQEAKPRRSTRRSHWRIPVKEGFDAFMRENHSLAVGS